MECPVIDCAQAEEALQALAEMEAYLEAMGYSLGLLDFPRWKTIGISIILLLGILFSIPSFLPEKTRDSLPSILQSKVNLGLDLAGGSHLLLEADIADLRKTQLTNMEKPVRTAMSGDSGPDADIALGELSNTGGNIR